ncbi:MAG TPA: cysteine--tRNA ligase [Candidatus Paceibacterota bacterium]
MALTFFNTLTAKTEVFVPLAPPVVSFYTCGPTVYAPPHLGNLRTFATGDWLRRTLSRFGYTVRQVINITDVDDKTIAGAQAANLTLKDFTERYEQMFLADLAALNILRPAALPKATDFVGQMIILIENLLKKGSAYQTDDGIYFKIVAFPDYGRLAKLAKIKTNETDQADFALWKFYKPSDGPTVWAAPFGRGRPGWHIECSAMIAAALGEQIDLHLGGTDLIFPHHENERAQSESLSGRPLARYWLHSAFVTMAEEKMAKSADNVIRLTDLVEKKISPFAYRYLLLTVHYRTLLNFSWTALAAAARAYEKLQTLVTEWADAGVGAVLKNYEQKFNQALAADLNLPQTLAVVWEMIKDDKQKRRDKLATLIDFDQVLGLNLETPAAAPEIPETVRTLVAQRETARQQADWPAADQLRQRIATLGYAVKDTAAGTQINPTK